MSVALLNKIPLELAVIFVVIIGTSFLADREHGGIIKRASQFGGYVLGSITAGYCWPLFGIYASYMTARLIMLYGFNAILVLAYIWVPSVLFRIVVDKVNSAK